MQNRVSYRLAICLCIIFSGHVNARDVAQETQISTGQYGGADSDGLFTMQCSGWFPDWVSSNPPEIDSGSFQLSQDYYPGVPLTAVVNGGITAYRAPEVPTDRPWMQIEFEGPQADPAAYGQALLDYAFDGMLKDEFDPNKAAENEWYHAPLMHAGPLRREALKGVTKERALRKSEYDWVLEDLRTVAIGFYDKLASYTFAQVYPSPLPQHASAIAAEFVNGAFVFKPIFSEFKESAIDPQTDPLIGAPEWDVQYPDSGDTYTVRLTQFDIAVKDVRSQATEWVFATYAYHKDLIPTEPNPWKRLILVGLQWGADGLYSPGGVESIQQSWINPELQPVWANHLGKGNRLNGPIDNPLSSCMSCHATAQVQPAISAGSGLEVADDFNGVAALSYPSCDAEEEWRYWYQDLPEREQFGKIDRATCAKDELASENYVALDYSLQIQRGLASALFYKNSNPCAAHYLNADVTTLDDDAIPDVDAIVNRITNSRLFTTNLPLNERIKIDVNLEIDVDAEPGLQR